MFCPKKDDLKLAKIQLKSFADFNPDFMKPYFTITKMLYNLRHGFTLKLPSVIFRYSGINSVLFRSCLLWTRLPVSIKQSQSLFEFKSKVKTPRNIVCT